MPRRSTRLSLGESPATEVDTKRKRLSAGSTIKSTAKKSKYFEGSDTDEPASDVDGDSGSAYEEEAAAHEDEESDDENNAYDEESEEDKPKKRERGRPSSSAKAQKQDSDDSAEGVPASKTAKGRELWREGVKTGLGPGKEVFIKKPKARDLGGIDYKDDTIHANTMLFLKDLKENNERQWLKAHDADYRASKKDWDTFVETMTEKIIEKDETIPELPAKDLVFRIHRDIRFSNDPTPYKTHFSAAWSRTGRKGPYAAYYLHLQPGHCFIGAGLWMPEASKLALLRRDVDRNSTRLKSVLRNAGLRREFFKGIPDDERKAVKAFVDQNQESALKTKPKGYEHDNPNIDLLRLRSYTVGKPLPDEILLSPDAQERIESLIEVLVPFVTYLNSVVMPDDPPSEGEDDQEDSE
ncbi:conserved hypothetical protein [Talaromyces stipitatus ATCC 10500]|uniref:TIGR02453 family protein n=1 Tax=Talaromyces stipitatus (strain ATCC 10500 / CBS 375.48 / QM 6759 / NRRL 1006) TaxID=441959 RepID=B8M6G9_TALSN|nr:uncharacterized protein TSTA_026530 [Talaromyces stipitatus ATCC 10500]EED19344.1 conserved hypothetical protein [Talaromyces stipitatus ATCC 10500]